MLLTPRHCTTKLDGLLWISNDPCLKTSVSKLSQMFSLLLNFCLIIQWKGYPAKYLKHCQLKCYHHFQLMQQQFQPGIDYICYKHVFRWVDLEWGLEQFSSSAEALGATSTYQCCQSACSICQTCSTSTGLDGQSCRRDGTASSSR